MSSHFRGRAAPILVPHSSAKPIPDSQSPRRRRFSTSRRPAGLILSISGGTPDPLEAFENLQLGRHR